jgi:AmiR/NasT family two-component response regulator
VLHSTTAFEGSCGPAPAPAESEASPVLVENEIQHMRVLIANDRLDRLAELADVVTALGHEVIARETDVESIGAVTARERPDVALVGLGLSPDHALDLIEGIVHEATCPVIALLSVSEPAYVREAAKRGVFASIVDTSADDLQSAIDVTLRRFTEYHDLQVAFARRALIEQAKGILMARHAVDAGGAFAMLRGHSQRHGEKLADVATALIQSHLLLPLAKPRSRRD